MIRSLIRRIWLLFFFVASAHCGNDDSPSQGVPACDSSSADCVRGGDGGSGDADLDAQRPNTEPDRQSPSDASFSPDATPVPPRVDAASPEAQVEDLIANDTCAHPPSETMLQASHTGNIVFVRVSGERALTQDEAGHWILWNTTLRQATASGLTGVDVDGRVYNNGGTTTTADLAGSTLLVSNPNGDLEIRDASDGQVLATVSGVTSAVRASSVRLALDGSYAWQLISGTSLKAWSRSGSPLLTHMGNYGGGSGIGTGDALSAVLTNESNQTAIERTTIADGAVTTGAPLNGTFHTWFDDGTHYITATGSTVRVFSPDGTQAAIIQGDTSTIPAYGGHGQFFWTNGPRMNSTLSTTNVYAIGTAQPLLSGLQDTPLFAGGGMIALIDHSGDAQFPRVQLNRYNLVDLRGAQPVMSQLDPPGDFVGPSYPPPILATDGTGMWVVAVASLAFANTQGTPRVAGELGCGGPIDVRGSDSGRVAIANEDGKVRVYDLTKPGHPLIQVSKQVVTAGGLSFATEGNMLGVLNASGPGGSYQLLTVPGGARTASFPANPALGIDLPIYGELARSAPLLGVAFRDARVTRYDVQGQAQTGMPITTSMSSVYPELVLFNQYFVLSPNGRGVAVAGGGSQARVGSSIYVDDVLVGAADGGPLAWLDDDHLLIQRQLNQPSGGYILSGMAITDLTGAIMTPLPNVPSSSHVRALDGARFYTRQTNVLYSSFDGSAVWTGKLVPRPTADYPVRADLAGSYAVVTTKLGVELERWQR